jgi:uncharacterized membrane protein YfcA
MDFLSWIDPLYSLSGFAVGMIVGLTGVGGGALMTPLLILLFGVHPSTAVGTDLLYAGTTKAAGTIVHNAGKTIDWRIVGRLAAGSIPATVLIVLMFSLLGMQGKFTGDVIQVSIGAIVLMTATALIFRTQIVGYYAHHVRKLTPATTRNVTIAIGFVLGVMVSLTSVGAGVIGVTALVMLYPDLPTPRIVGSDIAHAVPLALIAGSGYWIAGAVDFQVMGSLLVGSIPGIVIGSLFVPRMHDLVLRLLLATVLIFAGAKLLGIF